MFSTNKRWRGKPAEKRWWNGNGNAQKSNSTYGKIVCQVARGSYWLIHERAQVYMMAWNQMILDQPKTCTSAYELISSPLLTNSRNSQHSQYVQTRERYKSP